MSCISGSTYNGAGRAGAWRWCHVLVVLLAICIAGCDGQGQEAVLDSYNEKLARVLDQEMPHPEPHTMPRLPEVRALRRQFPATSINLLQFLEIRDCELGHLVAERNSGLGKVAGASGRLIYDINFLRSARACLALIGADHPKLAVTIRTEVANKQRRLPALIWQATLGGPEFRQFWRFGAGPIPTKLPPEDASLLAIRRLRQDASTWMAGDYSIDADSLEHQLDVIRRGRGGLDLRAWAMLSNRLDIATRILQDRQARMPLCYPGMHPPVADIFGNVVQEMFIRRIQPWAAQLNRRYYGLFPAVRSLESLLAAGEPPEYRDWRQRRDAALDHATHAILRHVKNLKPLLAQCSLMPQVR